MRAQFLHLSGPRRGRTTTARQDPLVIGTRFGGGLRFPEGGHILPRHAELVFQPESCRFLLRALEGAVFVNHRQVEEIFLEPGDLVELGTGGPQLRFRIDRATGRVCKPVRQILRDAGDVRKAGSAMAGCGALCRDLVLHTSWRLRVAVFGVVLAAAFVAGRFGAETAPATVQRELDALRSRVEQFRGDLPRREEVESLRAQLARQTDVTEGIVARHTAVRRILDEHAKSVCLLHGTFTLVTIRNGKESRVRGASSKPLEFEYVGSGFLATADGHVVTNRHVAEPWWHNQTVSPFLARGLKARLVRLDAIFPGRPPVTVDPSTIKVAPDDVDVAILRVPKTGLAPLPFFRGILRELRGQRVVLLGYPAGVTGLLARSDPKVAEQSVAAANDLTILIARLAKRGAVVPAATQGSLSEVRETKLVYDASTTHGGSGGPVFGEDGTVIGVNFAVTRDFAGANFGVPIRYAVNLLRR